MVQSLLFFLAITTIEASSSQPSSIQNILKPTKTMLTFVNGIGFNLKDMDRVQTPIKSMFGGRAVHSCHNPTAMTKDDDYMGYIGDLTQAGTQKLGKVTEEVNALIKHLKSAVQKVGSKGKVIHIAHSQGALITYLASKNLTKSEMAQMEVVCFGGAASIHRSPEYPFARCVNYYSVNDPLLFLVPAAARALRSGFLGLGGGSSHLKINGNNNNNNNNDGNGNSLPIVEEGNPHHDPNEEPEFVFLTPRGGDPILDHGLVGPTYIEALRWEANRYKSLYLPIWHPIHQLVVDRTQLVGESIGRLLWVAWMFVWNQCILPIVNFVSMVNLGVRERALKPILLLVMILWDRLKEAIRIWRGEDIYEPIKVKP